MSRDVLVTGIGLLTPTGHGLREHWEAALEGRSGLRELTRFDASRYASRIAGEISGLDPAEHLPSTLLPQTDVSTRIALVAAEWALSDAKLQEDAYEDFAMGTVTANAAGGFAFTHREFAKLWNRGPGAVSVYESFAWFYAVNTGQISIRHKLRGPGSAQVTGQAGGLDALGHARRGVLAGTPLMVAGGVDSALDPWAWAAQLAAGGVSPVGDPARAYLPFDADAAGAVPGEGGAILVLEDPDAARTRGAPVEHGRICGYAATFDPAPGTGRPPGLRRAIELALADAGVAPAEVGVVLADGAATPALDRAEAEAIAAVFGPGGVPVTVPKAATGRLLSGAGPVDVAVALTAIRHGVIPPSGPAVGVDPGHRLDLVVGRPRPRELTTALVLARGRGGFNAALVVRGPFTTTTGPGTGPGPDPKETT